MEPALHPVCIVMIEDDEGHARLIEKNIRRAGILNEIRHFTDGTSGEFDVVIQATGYNTTFPFFDREFLSADATNHIPLYKRMFSPGIDDLVFVGFAQSTPTLFPFVEAQARLVERESTATVV